jgi:hypothetical protein
MRTLAIIEGDGLYQGIQDYRERAWISLAVNRNGTGPLKDAIAVADWEREGCRVYKSDGSTYFDPFRFVSAKSYGHRFGTNDRCWPMAYPWSVGWSEDGNALFVADAGAEHLSEMSMRMPTDIDQDRTATGLGRVAWTRASPGGGLSAAAIYGLMGYSQLGLIQFQDMAAWSDGDIEQWISTNTPWLANDKANVRTYIRYCQLEPA